MFRRRSLVATILMSAAVFCAAQTATRPKVAYSTYFTGNGDGRIAASIVDANGYQYVTGVTFATSFPTTSNAYRRTATKDIYSTTGYRTMFVAKFNKNGTGLIYSTLIASANPEALAIDAAGNAYVVGGLNSAVDFPTTSGTWKRSCVLPDQLSCSFLLKLNPTGSGLIFSTLLNSNTCNESFTAIALDSTNHPHVTGTAGPGCFTTSNAYKRSFPDGNNAIVMKLTSDGSGVIYSTYLGGNNVLNNAGFASDFPNAIAVDGNGRVIVVGQASSTDFPTSQSAFQRTKQSGENSDAFVSKLSNDGSQLLASTLFGGGDEDIASDVAVDSSNQVYIVGSTTSKDFPITANAFQHDADPGFCDFDEDVSYPCNNGFVAKLPQDFSKPTYSTYLGGDNGDEFTLRVAADPVGHAFVAGYSSSTSFPLVKAIETNKTMFVSELNTAGSGLLFSTRYGSANCCTGDATVPSRIGVDLASNAYVGGNGFVTTTSNAFQTIPSDNVTAPPFAAKWDIPPCTLSSSDRTITICSPGTSSVSKKLLLAAGATDSRNVSAMKVYVDGTSVFSISASHFNTYLNLSAGGHHITVKAWDSVGSFSQSLDVNAL